MPRNSSGVYSLPAGNPVVTGTVISSVWANTTLDDIATALTDSLSRSGDGGMLDQFLAVAGSVGAPGISWSLEPTTGWYRAGAGDIRMSIAGVDYIKYETGRETLYGTVVRREWQETDAAANNQRWDIVATGEQFLHRVLSDAGTAVNYIVVNRTANTVDDITITATSIALTGVVSASSTLELGHASDTTLSRASAGVLAVEGHNVTTVDQTQTISAAWTFSAQMQLTASVAFEVNGAQPAFQINETDQGADGKIWRFRCNAGTIQLETRLDDGSIGRTGLSISRSGQAITGITLGNSTDNPAVTIFGNIELGNSSDTTLARSSAGFVSVESRVLGFLELTQNTQNGNYTLVAADTGKMIYKASGGAGETITIPANSSVAFAIGTMITFINQGGGTLSIAITTDTMTLLGTGATGTRTLADDGIATAIKVAATEWVISGTGLT